jgi:CRISPR/Cas system-associated endonuclease/helicase Cas3
MPNWCNNSLIVDGPIDDVNSFIEFVKGSDNEPFLFDKVIPYPDEYKVLDEATNRWMKENPEKSFSEAPPDGFNQGGYEWCVANWGTKWELVGVNASDVNVTPIDPTKATVSYDFDTAWSPPLPVIEKAGELFPTLRFSLEYEEPGMAFQGQFIVEEGRVALDHCEEYEDENEYIEDEE